MARQISSGKCRLCGGEFKSNAMSRHVQTCAAKHPLAPPGKRTRSQRLYHIQAKSRYGSLYWLHLLAPASSTLLELDLLLREVWLECCDHLSSFEIHDNSYSSTPDSWGEEESSDVSLSEVLCVGDRFSYTYDFGSSTDLELKVIGELTADSPARAIMIVARNAAPRHSCVTCGQPATRVCMYCIHEGPDCFFCKKCAAKHEERDDHQVLPITNSPRMGVCAYDGALDKDQDAYRL